MHPSQVISPLLCSYLCTSQITACTQSLVLGFVYGGTKTKTPPKLLDVLVQGKGQHTGYELICIPSQIQMLKSTVIVPQNVTLLGNRVVVDVIF